MIIALEDAKYQLGNFRENLKELGSALRIDELRAQLEELEQRRDLLHQRRKKDGVVTVDFAFVHRVLFRPPHHHVECP